MHTSWKEKKQYTCNNRSPQNIIRKIKSGVANPPHVNRPHRRAPDDRVVQTKPWPSIQTLTPQPNPVFPTCPMKHSPTSTWYKDSKDPGKLNSFPPYRQPNASEACQKHQPHDLKSKSCPTFNVTIFHDKDSEPQTVI
jgi:hypothetical protein